MTARPTSANPLRITRAAGALCAVTLLTVAATGCNSSANTATSGSGSSGSTSSCGTVPFAPFKDADGLIKALGSTYTTAYSGYPSTVQKSAWAGWKGKKSGTITIGISMSQLSNPYQTLLNTSLQKYLTADGYKVVNLISTNDVTNQISQFNQLITDKVDLILYQPLATGFESVIGKATKAGIPSISMLNTVSDPNTVNVVPNIFAAGEAMAAHLAKQMGGKGTILGVHGIKGVPVDTDTFNGAKAALAKCPGITMDDSIYTDFSPTTAQTKVQQYLAANPTKTIGGVMEGGPMTTGIMAAFQKSNVPLPTVADNGLTVGGVAYWNANKSSYQGLGLYNPADGLAEAVSQVAKHMLAGDGVKVSDIVINPPLVTSDNLSSYVKPAFKAGDASTVTESQVSRPFADSGYIDGFFGSKG